MDFLRSGSNSCGDPSRESGEPDLHAGAVRRRHSAHRDDRRGKPLDILACFRGFVALIPARRGRGFLDRRHVDGDGVLDLRA